MLPDLREREDLDDLLERIAPEEVAKAAAAISVVTYVIADMPERLPR